MKHVKILKHVGAYVPGEVVEVTDETAEQLCMASDQWDGEKLVPHVRAVLLDDWKAEQDAPKDLSKMSQAEAEAAGISVKTQSPPLPFEIEAAKEAKNEEFVNSEDEAAEAGEVSEGDDSHAKNKKNKKNK